MTKQLLLVQRLYKEIDLCKGKIDESKNDERAKLKLLQSNIIEYEGKLGDAFDQLTKKENEENIDSYIRYKDMLMDLSIKIAEKLELNRDSENKSDSNESNNSKHSLIKLSEFNLIHFYGDPQQWISFREVFSEAILKNDQLSKIQKLQYLQASVRGDASKLIRGYSLREENLQQCWEILCERYENKRQLAISQINKIFSIKISKANNSKTLLELLDTCNEAVRNLNTLGLESNALTDLILIRFMLSKLDETLKQRWELLNETDKIPDLIMFRKFIEREARSLNEGSENKSYVNKVSGYEKKISASHSAITKEQKCFECGQLHPLYKCSKFNSKTVNERWKFVKEKKLCINCLRANHLVDLCKINLSCKNCSARHHTLLHIYSVNNSANAQEQTSVSVTNSAQSGCTRDTQGVLLATALVTLKGKSGKFMECKALLDNGSQNSLLTKRCADKLNLKLTHTNHKLVGINGITAETCLHSTDVQFSPYFEENYKKLKPLVVDQITTPLPNFRLARQDWPHTNNLQLADPLFYKPETIDLLIGSDLFGTLITGAPIVGSSGSPIAMPTQLGYVLMGPISTRQEVGTSVTCHAVNLKTFFELENIPSSKTESSNDAEAFYQATTSLTSSGPYIVKLPFSEECALGNSEITAKKIFFSVERKLAANKDLKLKYQEFMHDYERLGHMSILAEHDIKKTPNFYLPHHAVTNQNSLTTSLRVVFNGSMASSNGKSLNSVLLKGPKLQTSIFSHLLTFRQYKIALTSDIAKMYRQILIHPEDTNYQRIFWRKEASEPLRVYRLNTVTYGVSTAPFLALKTLQQLCHDEEKNFPQAAKIAKTHFYVDDFLGGANTIDEARSLIVELQALFRAGGFELRKWSSSHPVALSDVPDALKASSLSKDFDFEHSQRILGLKWTCDSDLLQVIVGEKDIVTTKRQLLSVIARIFDPLGLLAPSIILLKIIMQEVWKANLGWDEQLPLTIQDKWDRFYSEINLLQNLKIPRLLDLSSDSTIEVHGFCDASPQAYAAVVYLKTISDKVKISLVAAKTRIAPTKPITLPRLELCGALLLTDLISSIKESLHLSGDTFYWTDSSITLCWILNPPQKGNPFVLHRASKIRSKTESSDWHHIPGKFNPADCLTRGLYPAQLKTNNEWWHGPSWLYEFTRPPNSVVSLSRSSNSNTSCGEELSSPNITDKCDILERFSSFTKLIRIFAWMLRFRNNALSPSKLTGTLSASELSNSHKIIVKLLQETAFKSELTLLRQNKPLQKTNRFLSLDLFIDPDNLIRVGGRLKQHPYLEFNTKHPILIPKNHPITQAIIRNYHIISLHGGPELVLSLIRQKYWIPDGRSTVKKELRKCIRCAKMAAQPVTQKMGDLPKSRITPCRPFEQTGIDFAGPILTKCQHKRKCTTFKGYICLFICMCTKAVHLELVSSLTSEAFLSTLRRFIARRGYPTDIFTDNGRNFVGAAAHLKTIFKLLKTDAVQNFCSIKNISWHFTPPYGPNFGGLWESSIKLAKRHLFKTLNGLLLTFEEMSTFLCLIEACINSRPLTQMSTDPNDLSALTPGHFLVGSSLLDLPDSKDFTNKHFSFITRWNLLQQSRSKFWRRWCQEYLNTLQVRKKWPAKTPPLAIGDLVLLKRHLLHPSQWSLARIIDSHPGKDGLCRVFTVKTHEGIFKRPIQEICRLPAYHNSSPPPGILETKGLSPGQDGAAVLTD